MNTIAYGKPGWFKAAMKYLPFLAATKPSHFVHANYFSFIVNVFRKRPFYRCLVMPVSLGVGVLAATNQAKYAGVSEILKIADDLYRENKFQDVYNHLIKYRNFESAEVLWRLARAAVDIGKLSKDKEFRQSKVYEGMEFIEHAMALDDENAFVHKWYAFCVKYTGEFEGTKKQIQNSYIIKEHLEKAGQLNPTDPTTQYALGSWAYTFADMGWVTRKMAETIFDTPPVASYEDALVYFERAEKMEPDFFSMNLLMIGKVYQAIGNKEQAIHFLRRAREYTPKVSADDKEAYEEAVLLLSKLGVTD